MEAAKKKSTGKPVVAGMTEARRAEKEARAQDFSVSGHEKEYVDARKTESREETGNLADQSIDSFLLLINEKGGMCGE